MRHPPTKESLILGELLWKRTKHLYESETEKARLHSYPFTERREVLYKKPETLGNPVLLNVYSDAAGLGNAKSLTGKGITGYGYGFIGLKGGKVFHNSTLRSGTITHHTTSDVAEAIGCLNAIKHAKAAIKKTHSGPINIDISLDNLNVVEALHDPRKAIDEIKNIEGRAEEMSTYLKSRHEFLRLVINISNEIHNDPKVMSVTTTWVKGHIFDSTRIEDLAHVENYLNSRIKESKNPTEEAEAKREKILFQALRNNKLVDKAALKGAFRSLTKRIDFLAGGDYACDKTRARAVAIAGALKNSLVARNTVVDYLATKSPEFLDETHIKILLGECGCRDVEKKRHEMAGELECKVEEVPEKYLSKVQKGMAFGDARIDSYVKKREVSIHCRFGDVDMQKGP